MPRPICYIDDCDRSHHGQGLCKYHYNIQRKASVEDGTWETVEVDAGPFKERIQKFLDLGYSYSMLAAVTGIDRYTFARAMSKDRQKTLLHIHETLERTPLTPLHQLWKQELGLDYRVPSYLAGRRVRALMARGWSTARLGEEMGLERRTVQRIAFQEKQFPNVMRSNLMKVVEAYDRLWDQEPPSTYRHCELTKYRHWPMPLEWDDDRIDLPGGEVVPNNRARNRRKLERNRGYKTRKHSKKVSLVA